MKEKPVTNGNYNKKQNQENTQFLGMAQKSRLNLEEHINRVRAKALNTIKLVAGIKWGGDQKILKKLYSVICRLQIDFGC